MSGKLGPFPLHVASRDLTLAVVQFTTVNGGDPTVYSDPGGVTASISRTGEGVVKVSLKDMYNYIYPSVNIVDSTTAHDAYTSAMVTGQSATNYVEVTTSATRAGAADDIAGAVVTLHLLLGN